VLLAVAEVVPEVVALGLQGVVVFVLDLPAAPPGLDDLRHVAVVQRQVGRKAAILIMSQSADRQPVIPAWMPESSHKDVNPGVAIKPFSNT